MFVCCEVNVWVVQYVLCVLCTCAATCLSVYVFSWYSGLCNVNTSSGCWRILHATVFPIILSGLASATLQTCKANKCFKWCYILDLSPYSDHQVEFWVSGQLFACVCTWLRKACSLSSFSLSSFCFCFSLASRICSFCWNCSFLNFTLCNTYNQW